MKKGKLIVIEGLDGSGKGTQSTLLLKKLGGLDIPAVKVSFPDYEDRASGALKMYLDGEFGDDPDSVNAYAASTFFAVDRFSSYKRTKSGGRIGVYRVWRRPRLGKRLCGLHFFCG